MYDQMEYDQALALLIQVLQVQGVSGVQKATAFLYMGICFTAVGRAEDAVQAFVSLLKHRPGFRLPEGVSPSIKAMFEEALSRLKMPATAPPDAEGQGQGEGEGQSEGQGQGEGQGNVAPGHGPGDGQDGHGPGEGQGQGAEPQVQQGPVGLKVESPKRQLAGQAIPLKIHLKDPRKMAAGVLVRWRRVGGSDYSNIKLKVKPGQELIKCNIPALDLGEEQDARGKILFYVIVLGAEGFAALAASGAVDDPHIVQVVQAPPEKSNWHWYALGIGAGLAVAGGVVAALLVTKPWEPGEGPLPGSVSTSVVFK